jgi:hypothetical protein
MGRFRVPLFVFGDRKRLPLVTAAQARASTVDIQ